MSKEWAFAAAVLLAGCGVETASTAATAGAIKKEEVEQGRRNLDQFQQKLDQANRQVQQSAERAGDDK
jgi:NifU-like protein involved in Fe-S cluster formation